MPSLRGLRQQFHSGLTAYLVVLFCMIWPVQPGGAFAHTSSSYYYSSSNLGKWPSAMDVSWYIRSGWPNSTTYYDRVKEAAWTWTSASSDNNDVDFVHAGTTATGGNAYGCASYSAIYYAPISDLDVRGNTTSCRGSNPGSPQRISIAINSNLTWYSGLGPTAFLDLRSTATHEFGHATSFFGHFTDTTACPSTISNEATMCPFSGPGETHKRSLEPHDIHT